MEQKAQNYKELNYKELKVGDLIYVHDEGWPGRTGNAQVVRLYDRIDEFGDYGFDYELFGETDECTAGNYSLAEGYIKVYEPLPITIGTQNKQPIKSTGGSSSYYDTNLPDWLIERIVERRIVKAEEIIEVLFGNDFNFGTAFKSLVRAYGITQGGGKAGNDLTYETNKIKYYADKILEKGEHDAN